MSRDATDFSREIDGGKAEIGARIHGWTSVAICAILVFDDAGLPGIVLGVSGAEKKRRAESTPLEPEPAHTGVGKTQEARNLTAP